MQPTQRTDEVPFHLTGAFAPVFEERTDRDLTVIGELPPDLCGTYVRNGPNPRSGTSPAWFAGDGMLHAVRFEGGRARGYRNRWIRGPYAPNTNVVRHAGRILSLVEARLPVEVSADLETVGPYDFGGVLARSMTAHPKICPRTGELLFFAYGAEPPHLTFYRADARGEVVQSTPIDVPKATYLHDFAITARCAVFYDLPVLVSSFKSPAPFAWDDGYRARIGIVPRDGRDEDVRWFDVAPCTISHTVNAFEDGDTVVLDAIRAPRLFTPHALYRYTFDLRTGKVAEETLDPRFVDFPRVHPAFQGAAYRDAYAVELCDFARGGFGRTRLHKYDVARGTSVVHDFGSGQMPGEAVVAPRPDATAEDDAWVLLFVHDDRGPSALVVLDAQRFDGDPVATVRLPCRVPFGFHGAWLPDGA
ncbi:carotenoid oxygenase family protein [Pendulispora albinea]|uniref:Carotenoid oxygenase family protein n=1 Tax=Pendulispora albinea TaxID=2741071 RepID=A0ABZ2LSF6_9BACT